MVEPASSDVAYEEYLAAEQTSDTKHEWLDGGEALLNPTVLVEVLSETTEDYDRGEKFAHYMRIPSLREYVLVSQGTPRIEVFRRPERGHWIHQEARAGGTIAIAGRPIHVDDIYRRAGAVA
jgi:Uma2 family endonuclease